MAPVAVLLLAYGTPGTLDQVEPYLLDVRGGRPPPPDLVAELTRRYAAIGGRSPLLDRTLEQAAALEQALGNGTRVHVGMRHWHPRIGEALRRIRATGTTRVIAIPLAPHYSAWSSGAYRRAVEAEPEGLDVAFAEPWHDHPRFLDAVAERIRAGLTRYEPTRREAIPLVFTAHSLPARIRDQGDPYVAHLEASVAGVLARLPARRGPTRLAFQSAGRTPEPWLGPDAALALEDLAAAGERDVLLAPIGFLSDHLEVLYDVDIELQSVARRLAVRLERTESLNASPLLIEALADLARRTATGHGWAP
jgi:ferrochelatase